MKRLSRIWYLKGGDAVEELNRLHPRRGELPIGGPDQYLLAVMNYCGEGPLTVVTLGSKNQSLTRGNTTARTYAARPKASAPKWRRAWAFTRIAFRYGMDALRCRPTHVFCGVEGPIAWISWMVARATGAELYYFSHCALDLPSLSRVYRFTNRFIVRHADRVVSNGPYLASEAVRLGADRNKVTEFNVGLDERDAQMLAQESSAEDTLADPLIVYAGRIEADKGVFDLLVAFESIRSQYPCQLMYLGEGAALEQLKQRAASTPHGRHICIEGQQPLTTVLKAIRRASVVATPTRSTFPEGRCKTLLEAFFAGTPVVAPDFGPFPHAIVSGENGLLYQADDVVELTRALEKIVSNKDFRAVLASGARATGRKMQSPLVSFYQALQ